MTELTETPDLDLTPRPAPADAGSAGSSRRWLPMLVLVAVVAFAGFVLMRTLGDAALFFYNADEAVDRRGELVDQRFRVQGTPFGETITTEVDRDGRLDLAVVFAIRFNDVVVDVVHTGAPAELFQPGVPVVLEGTWVAGMPDGLAPIDGGAGDGWHFASNDMVVKHDNEYRNDARLDYDQRLDQAERGGSSVEP